MQRFNMDLKNFWAWLCLNNTARGHEANINLAFGWDFRGHLETVEMENWNSQNENCLLSNTYLSKKCTVHLTFFANRLSDGTL